MASPVTLAVLTVLLVIISVSHQEATFINPNCSERMCTRTCFPDIWERDLCTFYTRLLEWASTARSCGLNIGPVAPWNRTLTASQQWEQARQSWNAILEVWNGEAASAGPTTPQGLMGELMSGSGSTDTDMGSMESPQHSQSAWVSSMQEWESSLTTWSMNERSLGNPTLPLPQPSVSRIIGGLSPTETPAAIRSNSADWSDLIADWRNVSSGYTLIYQDMCPETVQQIF